MMALFSDCQIVLELTGFSFKKKTEVKKKVTENGGVISYCLTKKVCTNILDEFMNIHTILTTRL